MAMFNDKHLHTIDQRSRLQLSRDDRDGMKIKKGDPIHLLPSPTTPPYLEVRTKAQWEAYQQRLMALPVGTSKREMFRFIRMMHETATADGQGRFVISQRLRDICGLGSEVAVVNMVTVIEVWKKEAIEQKYNDMLRAFNDISDKLF